MTEILLEGLEFYAHHGYFEEEQTLGNRFQVDIRIMARVDEAGQTDDLRKTVDYVKVYSLTERLMKERFKLLETLGQRIIDGIRTDFQHIASISVTISKFNPPISGLCRRVAVTRFWTENQHDHPL